MGMEQQSASATVAASPEDCFAVITDFDTYPQWSAAVCKTEVRDRYPDGLARQVEMQLDIKLRKIRYVLEYRYERPLRLTWTLIEGDLKAVTGAYAFELLKPGNTRMTCTQAIDIGFWIPGFLRAVFERQALKDSVEELKTEVEKRLGET